ncbi:response regulator [Candidatus Woesearchaeota archaeon]|nr:response regulator [Candidatus Woesearchaeota archaeon]
MIKGPILIVDDEQSNILKGYFEDLGYYVVAFSDGLSASGSIRNGLKYKVGIIDINLQGISGEEVIDISKEINPTIPIVSLSGWSFKPKKANKHIIKGAWEAESLEQCIKEFLI